MDNKRLLELLLISYWSTCQSEWTDFLYWKESEELEILLKSKDVVDIINSSDTLKDIKYIFNG